MTSKFIDCLSIANMGYDLIKTKIELLKTKNITPQFATILVGDNPSSLIYVKSKQKKADSLGIVNPLYKLHANATEEDVLGLVDKLNDDNTIHGILLQLPLPIHLDSTKIITRIKPTKDIDGLHPYNIGSLIVHNSKGYLNEEFSNKFFVPCTPLGCLHMLHSLNINLEGSNVVVLGRSLLVGTPVAQLFLNNNASVTILHAKSQDVKKICSQADILVVAIGQPSFIDSSYIKDNTIVMDVGISKILQEGKTKIIGDVNTTEIIQNYNNVMITPVPKGIGALTIMCLMYNATKSAWLNQYIS